MIIDSVKTEDLSNNLEEAFVVFEQRLRKAFNDSKRADRQENSDNNGNYHGAYAPERYYVSSILAFLDEYNLEIDVDDITELNDDYFMFSFSKFFNKINYAITRFTLRKGRIDSGSAGTQITLGSDYKEEIGKNIAVIRKIVNQEIKDENKKDKIFKIIAALQSEVDRDRTTVDALYSRIIDLSKVVGESAENMEPLVQKIERISNAIREGSNPIKLLTKIDRKQITSLKPKEENFSDDIPF
jgi:hypothetical protein